MYVAKQSLKRYRCSAGFRFYRNCCNRRCACHCAPDGAEEQAIQRYIAFSGEQKEKCKRCKKKCFFEFFWNCPRGRKVLRMYITGFAAGAGIMQHASVFQGLVTDYVVCALKPGPCMCNFNRTPVTAWTWTYKMPFTRLTLGGQSIARPSMRPAVKCVLAKTHNGQSLSKISKINNSILFFAVAAVFAWPGW